MADLGKRLNTLKETIDTKKAEKSVAEKKIEKIMQKLKESNITSIEQLKQVIKKKEEEIKGIEKEIEEKLKEAENVLAGNKGKD